MGVTVLNGSVTADDRPVGTGASVTEGKSLSLRSLIGAQAKAVRELSADAVMGLRHSASGYAGKAKLKCANLTLAQSNSARRRPYRRLEAFANG